MAFSLVAGLLAFLLLRHPAGSQYEPLASAGSPGERLAGWRATRLEGVERCLSASGGTVLRFAEDGSGQAEFALPHGGTSPRVWARVLPMASGEVRIELATPSGEDRLVLLPATAARDQWHWLDLGTVAADRLRLTGKGDAAWELQGLACVADGEFPPVVPVLVPGSEAQREFGDRFDRSPGHGLGEWQNRSGQWQVEFSLDPNRIPLQYSLQGKLAEDGGEALLVVDQPEWLGTRTSVSVFPDAGSVCGLALVSEAGAERFLVQAGGGTELPQVVPGQWYRLTVEAWGWTRRFLLDGREIAVRQDASPLPHRPGLLLTAGEARFDDVQVSSVAWGGEDGGAYRLPWQPAPDAVWQRRVRGEGAALVGKSGTIALPEPVRDLQELVLWQVADAAPQTGLPTASTVFAQGSSYRFGTGDWNWYLGAPARIGRVAVAAFANPVDLFRIGPYRFDANTIPDPSDYLDFTPEEWEEIRRSPDADKLARKAKETPVVGRSNQVAIWGMENGRWRVADGVLASRGQAGRLRFWQELEGDCSVSLRLRLGNDRALARVILAEREGEGISVAFHGPNARPAASDLAVSVPSGQWVDCRIELAGDTVAANGREQPVKRGVGGGLLLENSGGEVAFDDVEITVPRWTATQWFSAFDRRETDWWREGGEWIDHGGMSCALASNWVSLVAPQGRGMIWHKESLAGDVLLATNIEENSEWMGWEKNPSHIHYPADNIVLCLGQGRNLDNGYRLEVNSRDRTATVLYRAGKEVANVRQDHRFPIQYQGGHAPYSPRRSRITLLREGDRIRGLVNGVEVISYRDGEPLATDTVGIGGYQTHVNFSRIMVRRLDAIGETH